MEQLKTKIKVRLIKLATEPESTLIKSAGMWDTTKDIGSNMLGGAGHVVQPVGHAWGQLAPGFLGGTGEITDIQKIKNYLEERKIPKSVLGASAREKAWQGAKEGMKGVGTTAVGLGMGIPAAGAAAYYGYPVIKDYGPQALNTATDYLSQIPEAGGAGIIGAGVGGLGGATVGHGLFKKPWASRLGAVIGAGTGGTLGHQLFGG